MPPRDQSLRDLIGQMTGSPDPGPRFAAGELLVDITGYRAEFQGRELDLSTSQFETLAILVASRRICSRQELSEALGLYGARTVDTILSKIRHHVGRDFIRNVHGLGWIVDSSTLED